MGVAAAEQGHQFGAGLATVPTTGFCTGPPVVGADVGIGIGAIPACGDQCGLGQAHLLANDGAWMRLLCGCALPAGVPYQADAGWPW
ncbi:hypothetical protein BTM36_04190, partial [Herbaspirillum sp. VT-16-41]